MDMENSTLNSQTTESNKEIVTKEQKKKRGRPKMTEEEKKMRRENRSIQKQKTESKTDKKKDTEVNFLDSQSKLLTKQLENILPFLPYAIGASGLLLLLISMKKPQPKPIDEFLEKPTPAEVVNPSGEENEPLPVIVQTTVKPTVNSKVEEPTVEEPIIIESPQKEANVKIFPPALDFI